jgi:pilus assembly protein Flp/PilA
MLVSYCPLTSLSYILGMISSIIRMGVFMHWDAPTGQGLVEYALVILLVGIAVVVILAIFGPAVGNMFSQVITGI